MLEKVAHVHECITMVLGFQNFPGTLPNPGQPLSNPAMGFQIIRYLTMPLTCYNRM